MSRVMIAGTGSGCGKTSVTCGLLAALQNRGRRVSACKCGPDYIDPMFHREVLGAPSRNLDLFLCGEAAARALLAESERGSDLAVIEGVMGFYDGLADTGEASSHHMASCTQTPVILTVNCSGKSLSLAAEVQGYARFRANTIAGVLLNRCSARSYPMLKALVEENTGLPVLGYLPKLPEAALESRHLGLVTAGEVADLRAKVDAIAAQMEKTVDLDAILSLAEKAPVLEAAFAHIQPVAAPRIAVAQDEAFCFTYADNLALLEKLGARLAPFSPLTDQRLPENIQGILLSGGYPELYLERLSANRELLRDLREAVERGTPTIAECGGFMVLCREIVTLDGARYPMAGAVDSVVEMTRRLSRFGYVTMTAQTDNMLCPSGGELRAHEFHYSEASDPGAAFSVGKHSGASWESVHAGDSLYAGYPHLHFWGDVEAARRFVLRCARYAGEGGDA